MFAEVYNGETDNNDNPSRKILSKQWTFYQCFSELAHFWNEKLLCILSVESSCEKDTGITVFIVVCAFPNCREGEVLRHLFYHPYVTKLGTVVAKAMVS